MPDTHLILHIKGTDSQTAALLREEVRAAVWLGKITQSQLIWRPTENAWKPVKDLPELIPPVEHLILHVKGTDAETRQLPRPAVREGITKGSITHSQLIWRPTENMWKQVREMPELMPSQKIAPAPMPARVPTATPVDEIIPESPAGPVARAVAAHGAPPRVKMPSVATPQPQSATPVIVPVAVPQVRAVTTPEAVPHVRVAVAAEEAPQPRAVATPQIAPHNVPRVRVAVQPEETPAPEEISVPEAVAEMQAVAAPASMPRARVAVATEEAQPRPVAIPQVVPRVRIAQPEEVPVPQEIAEPETVAEVQAVAPSANVPRVRIAAPVEEARAPAAVAIPQVVPQLVPRVRVAAQAEEVPQPRAVPVAVPQMRAVAAPEPQPTVEEGVFPSLEEIPQPEIVETPQPVPQVRAAVAPMIPRPRAVPVPEFVPQIRTLPVPAATPSVAAIATPEESPPVRAVATPFVPQPRAMPVVVPHIQAADTPRAVPQIRTATAAPAVVDQPQAVAREIPSQNMAVEEVPTGLVAKAAAKSRRIKEEATSHPLKSFCIGLGLVITFLLGSNYLFVDRPLVAAIKASEFSGVSVYGHLAAFMQPNVIVIHVPSTKMVIEENFTKFLVDLAHATPSNPITMTSFSRVALTSRWTAEYSFSGENWKQIADLGDETETARKEFIMAHLDDAGGDPVISGTTLHEDSKAARREEIWLKFVDTFAVKPPR